MLSGRVKALPENGILEDKMNLCSPKTVRELLLKYGLSPKKGYGQNFLINPDIPERIAASSALGHDAGYEGFDGEKKAACAFEIGPGIGAMTSRLSDFFEKVVAVEIDKGLIPLLSETLAECDNVDVINADFMEIDLKELFENASHGMPIRVCANLPYYVTTPVLMKLLEEYPLSEKSPIESVTVMVQTEVADRICASPENSNYGALSASVALYGKAEKLFTVSAGNFYPAPKVSSAVVQITLYDNGISDVFDEVPTDDAERELFLSKVKKLISLSFLKRRKTLVNALSGEFSKEKIEGALEALGIRKDVRGERLSARDYCALANVLYGYCEI